MSPAQSNEVDSWYGLLDEMRADGYTPVKCVSPLCFFTLEGRKTVLSYDNIIPIKGMEYVYKAGDKFFLRKSREWSLDEIYFYRPTLTFSGYDEAMEILRMRIVCGQVWVLFTKDMVADMSAMLSRLYSSYWKGEGKVPYKIWIELLEESLRLEDYKATSSNKLGFRTQCKIKTDKIDALWNLTKGKQK